MTQKLKTIFLIINQFAGHGQGSKAFKLLQPYLSGQGLQLDFAFTEGAGHATRLARAASEKGFDLVVAVGGDGTVNETAQGLIGTTTAMGIIPVGSGNGLARELGLSMNIKKSARKLVSGLNRPIDVCRLNEQRFLCTSGIGFDALIAHQMSKASRRGFLKYIQLVISESIRFKPVNIRMKVDGALVQDSVFLVTFANASQFGNNAFIAPAASMSDGLIDVVVVRRFLKFWMPVFGIALFSGHLHKLPFVTCYKARKIELELAETPYFHFDGEPGKLQVPAIIRLDQEKILIRS